MTKISNITLIIVILITVSCSSARDIYQPIPKRNTVNSGKHISNTPVQSPPDWTNQMSSDFIVGKGTGESLELAREESILDIKVQISKSLGESITSVGQMVYGNKITGRNKADSESFMFQKTDIKNAFNPVIDFNFEFILDSYYCGTSGNFSYFIKYKITPQYLQSLKKKIDLKENERKELIYSLANVDSISTIEDLLLRNRNLQAVNPMMNNFSDIENLKLTIAKENIERIIQNLQIQVLSNLDKDILISIQSLGKFYKFSIIPEIIYPDNIYLTTNRKSGDNWRIAYNFNDFTDAPETINILVSVDSILSLNKQITTAINPVPEERSIKISQVSLNIEKVSQWSGDVRKIKLKMIMNANFEANMHLVDLELFSGHGQKITLSIKENDSATLNVGENTCSISNDCDIPMRFFTSGLSCNIRITIVSETTPEEEILFDNQTVQLKNP